MARIVLLSIIMLTSCASFEESAPLKLDINHIEEFKWFSNSKPITQCKSSILEDIEFTVSKAGNWRAKVRINNANDENNNGRIDLHNKLQLVFVFPMHSNKGIKGLNILSETINALGSDSYESHGHSKYLAKHFFELERVRISLKHECTEIQ